VSGLAAADFHLGAAVFTREGVHAGTLHRVIVEEAGFDVRGIIVEASRAFHGSFLSPGTALLFNDLVVPIAAVATAAHDRVELGLTAPEARRLPPYLSIHFHPVSAGGLAGAAAIMVAGGPAIPPADEAAAKPGGEIEIDRGENVMLGSTGRRLGVVEDVLLDGGELVGIVLRAHHLREPVFLPVRFLDRGDDLALFALLSEEDLARLRPFHPEEV
jgi:sporulation protein YlmC with PRC-barrel domain